MKDKLIYIGIFCFLFMACSLDDVLKTSDKVNVEIMESTDTVRPLPGDTISFKFLLSTNGGTLKRLEITDKTFDFDVVPENIRFAMVDTSLKLSLDANGYFSRPVSTVLVMYPMVVPFCYEIIVFFLCIIDNNTLQ